MKMKLLHKILKGISLTGALFVFQACYGTPQVYESERGEASMSFTLLSGETAQPLQGIQIYGRAGKGMGQDSLLGSTDANGQCQVEIPYIMDIEGPYLRFEDPSNDYSVKDTVISDLRYRNIVIKLNSSKQ